MTRIFVAEFLAAGTEIDLPDAAARHVAQVLRARVGEHLVLFNGQGGEYQAEILSTERRGVRARVTEFHPVDRESRLRVTLAQCVSRGERMDYTLQKAVELGIAGILPLVSERSIVRLDAERWERKLDHWRGIVVAASEQSGRTAIPGVSAVEKYDEWVERPADGVRLVMVPGAPTSLATVPAQQPLTLIIGPEGGLSDPEVAAALRQGCVAIGMGPRVLRTETAGLAALSALQALHGDLG